MPRRNREGYPDPTQFDATSYKFDAKSSKDAPRWISVDLKFAEKFAEPLTLSEIKNDPSFEGILVAKQGMRLSVQPVTEKHYKRVCTLRSKKKTK